MPSANQITALEKELKTLLHEEEPAPSDGAPPPSGAPARAAVRILVVDDNEDYRGLVRSVLKERGYEVREACDGAAGLALLRSWGPQLLIVDYNMPTMNGYELIQELRHRSDTRKLPIIMFSGAPHRRQLKEMRRELHLDVADFLDKPVSNAALVEAVAKALGSSPPPPLPAVETAAPPAPPPAEETVEPEESLEMVQMESEEAPAEDTKGLELLANDSPLVNQVNKILLRAVEMGASDIHIEPQEKNINVRLRLDGSLKPLCSIPIALNARLAARIKIMSNLVITERRLPQDGQFRAQIRGQKIEFRVSTLPSAYGEKIVIRVLGQSKLKGDLGSLGVKPRDLDCLDRALRSPHGLILMTGPTGSGKTTTLYTMLAVLNNPDVNVMTAEDPVEYRLPGITQIQIQSSIGLTFEKVLRAFLRQDPDIMLVGEIRDKETAEIAIKASITGHLVLSTLHTNSAPTAVTRLTHMGIAPYLVAASVRLVIAQRLVKLLCPDCRVPAAVSAQDARFLREEEKRLLKKIYREEGCRKCRQTGYAGRKPLFEVMPVQSAEMRELVLSGQSADRLGALAAAEGMTGLRQAAIEAVADGSTSLHEALKLIAAEAQ